MPKVSIIVPVYNTSAYLRRCMDALTGQTLEDIEIIAVNDGSTDDSPAILGEYEQKDSRVRVFHKVNGGQATARNMGIRRSHGEYVGFADSDDYVDADRCMSLQKRRTVTWWNVTTTICRRQKMTSGS